MVYCIRGTKCHGRIEVLPQKQTLSQGQVLYLGGDPRKPWKRRRKREGRAQKNTEGGKEWAGYCFGQVGINPNGTLGRQCGTCLRITWSPHPHCSLWGLGIYPLISIPYWLTAAPLDINYPVLPFRWRVTGACGRVALAGPWWLRGEGTWLGTE